MEKLTIAQAEKLTGVTRKQVERLKKKLQDPEKYREELLGVEYLAAHLKAKDDVRGTGGTGDNEWYTPAEYIERVRAVLGEIDLDPASSEQAQQTVRATNYFTLEDDGLTQSWYGRVFLNPPYAQPLIASFLTKLADECKAERVTAAITLTHNYTDTEWFQDLAKIVDAFCFTEGRVKFIKADDTVAIPTQGQVFCYFGPDVARFAEVFDDVGLIVVPYLDLGTTKTNQEDSNGREWKGS